MRSRLLVFGRPRIGGVDSIQAKTCWTHGTRSHSPTLSWDQWSNYLSLIAKTGTLPLRSLVCIYPISLRTITGLLQTQRRGVHDEVYIPVFKARAFYVNRERSAKQGDGQRGVVPRLGPSLWVLTSGSLVFDGSLRTERAVCPMSRLHCPSFLAMVGCLDGSKSKDVTMEFQSSFTILRNREMFLRTNVVSASQPDRVQGS